MLVIGGLIWWCVFVMKKIVGVDDESEYFFVGWSFGWILVVGLIMLMNLLID